MMNGTNGGRSVNIKREDLLKYLRENLVKHTAEVAKAKEDFKIAGEKMLTVALKNFRKNPETLNVRLAAVVDYTDTYKRIIAMLELSTDDVINVSESDFQKFVLDEWEWQGGFKALTQTYVGAIGG